MTQRQENLDCLVSEVKDEIQQFLNCKLALPPVDLLITSVLNSEYGKSTGGKAITFQDLKKAWITWTQIYQAALNKKNNQDEYVQALKEGGSKLLNIHREFTAELTNTRREIEEKEEEERRLENSYESFKNLEFVHRMNTTPVETDLEALAVI